MLVGKTPSGKDDPLLKNFKYVRDVAQLQLYVRAHLVHQRLEPILIAMLINSSLNLYADW